MAKVLALTKDRIEDKSFPVTECGCWIWTGSTQVRGYGEIISNGKKIYAHRASYTVYKGDIPKGMYVCHKCDTVSCVNPDHLFLGTQRDNMHDMIRKGRSGNGRKHPSTKLTEEEVLIIMASNEKTSFLSSKYNISPSWVNKLRYKGDIHNG
jgi:hypothetical protein